AKVEQTVVVERMTTWFCERLPELLVGQEEEQGARWREVQTETDSLVEWLPRVVPSNFLKVQQAGNSYAQVNGPYAAWMNYCERALGVVEEPELRSHLLWTLANVANNTGAIDRGLSCATEMLALATARNDERDKALALSLVADVKMLQGEVDEATIIQLRQV